jgi:hypothetical protein
MKEKRLARPAGSAGAGVTGGSVCGGGRSWAWRVGARGDAGDRLEVGGRVLLSPGPGCSNTSSPCGKSEVDVLWWQLCGHSQAAP